jgi:hypothetical protein
MFVYISRSKPGIGIAKLKLESKLLRKTLNVKNQSSSSKSVNNGVTNAGKFPYRLLHCAPVLPWPNKCADRCRVDQSKALSPGLDGQTHHCQTQMGPRISWPSKCCRQLHECQTHQCGRMEGWREGRYGGRGVYSVQQCPLD